MVKQRLARGGFIRRHTVGVFATRNERQHEREIVRFSQPLERRLVVFGMCDLKAARIGAANGVVIACLGDRQLSPDP